MTCVAFLYIGGKDIMKFLREEKSYEFIITNKKGEKVKIKETSYLNVGKMVSLYGSSDQEARDYMRIIIEGNDFYRPWPRVKNIKYDEVSDLLLFQDLIEIYDEYNELDEPFIIDIYYYVDFNGYIVSDGYVPMLDQYFPLNVYEDIPRCPWLENNNSPCYKFLRRYQEVMEDIGWQIIDLLEVRKRNFKENYHKKNR